MRTEYLADNIAHAETVADWIYNEFIKGIRYGISYEQTLSAVKDCKKTELPIRLIAMDGDTCVGTVAIVQNDLKGSSYSPWLASLYVAPSHRRKQIGERLVERVKGIAKELGYDELYLRTEQAGDYYRRLGWQYVESCEDEFGLKPDVFRFVLG